jgi:hypothetical protein
MRLKRLLKILAYSFLGFGVFLLALAGVTQTQVFRDGLRTFALSRLDSLLDAEVQLGTITGNLVSGFSIDHLSIKIRHDYLIVAERLDIRYDLFEIPGKTISVDNLTLVKPQIALLRGRDSTWNFTRMVRPTPDDTAATKPFNWIIHLKHFKIEDGTIELVDSASLAEPDHPLDDPYYVEYHNVALKRFNLETSLTVSGDEKRAIISSFNFESARPEVSLKQLSGDFSVTSTEASVRDMVLQTGLSSIQLDALMKGFDLLGGVDLERLQKKPVRLSLRAHRIDLNELKRFIPQIGFLGSQASLDLEVNGEFGELDISALHLKSGDSEFLASGTLYNLHTPSELYLNTKFERSAVYSPDVRAILPTFDLPDFEQLGRSKLNLTFIGTPLDFQTTFSLETNAGTVRTDGTLKIGGPNRLQYAGNAQYRNLDVAAMTNDPQLKSNLNGTVHIDGHGISLDNLLTTIEVQLDSSMLAGREIRKIQLKIDAADRKLTASSVLAIGSMRTTLDAVLDQRDEENPLFTLNGDVASLNLEELLQDPSSNSDLNVAITAQGSGLRWGTLNGEFLLNFKPSRYREYQIDASDVRLAFDQRDPRHKELSLNSNIADFSLVGAFDTEYMKDLIAYQLLSLRKAVGERFVSLDSSFGTNVDPATLKALEGKLSSRTENLNATFSLRVKELEPISVITSKRTFNGIGVLSGEMHGGFQDLSLDARLTVDDFFYGSADSGILIHNGAATLDVGSLKPHTPLRDIAFQFVAQADNMHINRSEFDSLRVNFKYEREYSSYTALGQYNHDTRVLIQGFSNISGDLLNFTLNSLHIGYKDFMWQADGGTTIGFGTRGIRVDNLTIRRDTQVVSLSGSIINGRSLTASVSALNIHLDDLKYLLAKEELDAKSKGFAGTANISFKAEGTLEDPTYSARLNANAVAFRGVPLGDVTGIFSYKDQSLSTDVEVVNNSQTHKLHPDLLITGTIPVNLALTETEHSHLEKPMTLNVQSEGIQIGILDPILPTFNQLTGLMKCNVTVGGSPKRPNYGGTLSVENGSFLFVPNLINYTLDGRFRFSGERIEVVDALVRSNPADDQFKRSGLLRVSGNFALRDFRPADFNLNVAGGLLVVRETTRKSSLSVYGNLFIETGTNGLRYTGEIEQSMLKGYVLVNNSSLIFPPTQQVVNEQWSNTVPVHFVDDTAKTPTTQAHPLVERYFGTNREAGQATNHRNTDEQTPSKSFVDGIRYDLDIECTGGNAEIKMVFNSATSEELDANINGKFSITEDGKRWIGTLTIDRAYYRFIKQFNAEGTIKYSGDFLNPDLDITAKYEGFRTTIDTTSSTRPEKVVVFMKITGSRLEPKLDWSMTIDEVDYYSYKGAKSSDVQTDALAFILAGTFPLTKSQANDLAVDLGPTARSSLFTGAGSLFTNALSDFLRNKTGFIHSVELSYGTQSSFSEAADIRLSGVAAGGVWRYGGKILNDPLNNANISLLYSLGEILERPSMRNFMFELERKVELNTIGVTTDRKLTNSARLFYRFSF